jgi:hypothetical protein
MHRVITAQHSDGSTINLSLVVAGDVKVLIYDAQKSVVLGEQSTCVAKFW